MMFLVTCLIWSSFEFLSLHRSSMEPLTSVMIWMVLGVRVGSAAGKQISWMPDLWALFAVVFKIIVESIFKVYERFKGVFWLLWY